MSTIIPVLDVQIDFANMRPSPVIFNDEIAAARYFRSIRRAEDCVAIIRGRPRLISDEARGYQWGVVYELISQAWGWEPEEVHDFFRAKYLRRPDGRIMSTGKGQGAATTEEMMAYIEKVRRDVATGKSSPIIVFVPDPSKVAVNPMRETAARNYMKTRY